MTYEKKIEGKGYKLPSGGKALGAYVLALKVGDMVYLSGVLPKTASDSRYTGKLGKEISIEDGCEAAKVCALNALSAIKDCIGDLEKVKRFVRITGYINSAPGFTEQTQVLDGASEFLVDIFGEKGKHTRLAIGVSELPKNFSMELDFIVQVEP